MIHETNAPRSITEPLIAQSRAEGANLTDVLDAVKAIRKSDCGAWLKDCNGVFRCSDGRTKRQEMMRLLDKLYSAAGI